jgi:hypothetical protein
MQQRTRFPSYARLSHTAHVCDASVCTKRSRMFIYKKKDVQNHTQDSRLCVHRCLDFTKFASMYLSFPSGIRLLLGPRTARSSTTITMRLVLGMLQHTGLNSAATVNRTAWSNPRHAPCVVPFRNTLHLVCRSADCWRLSSEFLAGVRVLFSMNILETEGASRAMREHWSGARDPISCKSYTECKCHLQQPLGSVRILEATRQTNVSSRRDCSSTRIAGGETRHAGTRWSRCA